MNIAFQVFSHYLLYKKKIVCCLKWDTEPHVPGDMGNVDHNVPHIRVLFLYCDCMSFHMCVYVLLEGFEDSFMSQRHCSEILTAGMKGWMICTLTLKR